MSNPAQVIAKALGLEKCLRFSIESRGLHEVVVSAELAVTAEQAASIASELVEFDLVRKPAAPDAEAA